MPEIEEYNAQVIADSGKTVNLRKSPSTNSAVLAAVPIGSIVLVVDHENDDWARASYAKGGVVEINGYMMRKYLKPVGEDGKQVTLTLDYDVAVALYLALQSVVKE